MTQSKKIIALTGGIGSGKSLAAEYLKKSGYKVVSCDELTGKLYGKRKIKVKLSELFPTAVSGKIFLKVNKKVIAEQAFKDKKKLEKLNALLHPLIIAGAIKRAKKGKGKIAFVEIPLLFETESVAKFDGVIVITRPLNDRVEAVCKRSHLTENEVSERIKSQFDYDTADLSAYTVIENDSDKQSFLKKVNAAVETIIKV